MRYSLVVAAAVASLGGATAAAAQQPVSFGVGLGGAAAQGGDVGLHGLATLGLATPYRPLQLRLDGTLSRWSERGVSERLGTVTGNVAVTLTPGRVSPYLIGGLGLYAPQGAAARFGWNGGAGARVAFGRVTMFTEVRAHTWSAGSAGAGRAHRMVPLTVGLLLR